MASPDLEMAESGAMYRLFASLIWACTGLISGSGVGRRFGVNRLAWNWPRARSYLGVIIFGSCPIFLLAAGLVRHGPSFSARAWGPRGPGS